MPRLLLAIVLLTACVENADEDTGPRDLTVDVPVAEDGRTVWDIPPFEIPPAQEVFMCFFGTWDGPTVGVNSLRVTNPDLFYHHSLLKEATEHDPPDGTLVDCTSASDQWPPRATLFEQVGNPQDPNGLVDLPEGIAFRLEAGQRWQADLHYVNTSTEPVLVNNVFDLGLIPIEEVEHIAGTFNMDVGNLQLPPGEETSLSFACEMPNEINILSMGGHMHALGRSFVVQHWRDGEDMGQPLNEQNWEPDFQFGPPVNQFEPGEVTLMPGDLIEPTCTWFNPFDETVAFPEEMCTTFGVGYPIENSFHCDGGGLLAAGDGVIELNLTLDGPPEGDGVGEAMLMLWSSPPGAGDPTGPSQLFRIGPVDVNDGFSVAVEEVVTGDTEWYPVLFVDDNDSGLIGGPDPGDLLGVGEVLIVPTTEPVTLDLVLGPLPQ